MLVLDRVSQGWAGTGYGSVMLPRVGQEVLVGFLDGDPDQPIIVGRVFNAVTRHPYNLPDHKTRSTWKSASSPGGRGHNEILFEDLAGAEPSSRVIASSTSAARTRFRPPRRSLPRNRRVSRPAATCR